jgi:predicted MFS family arabinose efflux permease
MSALAPLRVPAFRRLGGAYAINRTGDMVAIVALAIVVWDETHSTLATTALFIALEFVPALAAPALTARLDRIPTGRVLPAVYALEAAVFCLLALLSQSFSLVPLLALVAVDGALGVVARALGRGAIAAVLAPTGQLREGNALLNMALAPNMAIGGALGAGLIAWSGADAALLVNAATFGFAGLMVLTARGLPRYDADDDGAPVEHWRTRLSAALTYIREHRALMVLLCGQAAAMVFFALTEPIEVAYTRDALGAGAGGYGAMIAAWGVGIMVGSVLYTWLGTKRLAAAALVATLLQGVAYVALGAAPDIEAACAISIVGGAANGTQLAAVATAIQEAIALDFQARVMSIYEAAMTAAPGIGYLLGGGLGAAFGGRAAFTVAGVGVLVVLVSVLVARPTLSGYVRAPRPEASSA